MQMAQCGEQRTVNSEQTSLVLPVRCSPSAVRCIVHSAFGCRANIRNVPSRIPFLLLIAIFAACTTDTTRRGYLRAEAAHLPKPPRPVVIIPGFGVTRLFDPVTGRFVWGTPHSTVQKHFADDVDLPVSDDGTLGRDRLVPRGFVGSRGPINTAWQLTVGLAKFAGYTPSWNRAAAGDVNAYPFAYDWRLPAAENAERLDALVESIRRDHADPALRIDIITHSAGALVALAYVKLGPGRNKVDHLILIAPAERGVVDSFRFLVRPERFIRRAFSADVAVTFPSITELLPEDGQFLIDPAGRQIPRDLWDAASWKALQLSLFSPEMETKVVAGSGRARYDALVRAFSTSLACSRSFRRSLADAPLPANVKISVLAGDCVATAKKALLRGDGTVAFYRSELRSGERSLDSELFEPGDGTVPRSSALAGGSATLFCDGHQGLASDPNVQRAIIRTLFDDATR
jgi:pimeloyl-ACP methyl ester carboxylesterase